MISFGILSYPNLVFTTMPHFWMAAAAKYIPSVKEALSWLSSCHWKYIVTHNSYQQAAHNAFRKKNHNFSRGDVIRNLCNKHIGKSITTKNYPPINTCMWHIICLKWLIIGTKLNLNVLGCKSVWVAVCGNASCTQAQNNYLFKYYDLPWTMCLRI